MRGIGYCGEAEQRVELHINAHRQPHDCLRQNSTAQPDWNAIFAHYQTQGTQILIASVPNGHPVANFATGRNHDLEANEVNNAPPFWTGDAPGTGSTEVRRSNNEYRSGQYSMRVRDRSSQIGGASHSVQHFLKPETPYLIEVWVCGEDFHAAVLTWRFTLRTKTVGNPAISTVGPLLATQVQLSGNWVKLSRTLTSNDWSGVLEYAWLTVSCDNVATLRPDFFMDDFLIKDASTGRFIYKQAVNANGINFIDCESQNLYIERSRICGTLLVLNPGPNSRIDYGPIHWSPHIPGYPALLVNGNFSIRATNQPLSEADNAVNYNPSSPVAFPYNGSADSDSTDQYASEIHGLVCVSGNLTYKYTPQIRGRMIVGGNGGNPVNNGSPTLTYLPDSLLSPPPPLGGFYSYNYDRQTSSTRKVVLP